MGLALQDYLRSGKGLVNLEEEYGVYSYQHPTLPLVGFKYGVIESKKLKFHPIIRESRGIVLEKDSWNVVAYPFKRFYNLGDDLETESNFNWKDYTCQEKKDGSEIILYYYDGDWRVNTSGSFAQGICYDSGKTWEELFWITSGIDKDKLTEECTYIFELWTKYNKIVRSYDKPHVTLLGVRHNDPNYIEWPTYYLYIEAKWIGVSRPTLYSLNTIEEISNFLLKTSQSDPTFEGFVLCDDQFRRIKIKSDSYKQLHQLKGNGVFIYRNIVPQLLKGNFGTLSKDFPEWLEELEECNNIINTLKQQTDNVWFTYQLIKDRKKFAQMVIKDAIFPSILFYLYDGKFSSVEEAFLNSEDLLIKYFENKK